MTVGQSQSYEISADFHVHIQSHKGMKYKFAHFGIAAASFENTQDLEL